MWPWHEVLKWTVRSPGVLGSQPSHGKAVTKQTLGPTSTGCFTESEVGLRNPVAFKAPQAIRTWRGGALKKSMQTIQYQIKILPSTCSHSASEITSETHWLTIPLILFRLHTCLLTTPNTVRKRIKSCHFTLSERIKSCHFCIFIVNWYF